MSSASAMAERRTFEFHCDRCKRLLASAVVESATFLLLGESNLHGLLLCEDCRRGWVERDTKELRAEIARLRAELEHLSNAFYAYRQAHP